MAKFIVPAVPTTLLSSLMTTPEPEPITLVNPEPSPTNVAVTPLGPLNDCTYNTSDINITSSSD